MKLIILDRDGVINYDSQHYIKSPAEWLPIPGSLEALAKLMQAGFTIAIATNQSGIARGLYTHQILADIHTKMRALAEAAGGKIDSIFYCPHHPDEHCHCRKPQPGLLEQIAAHYAVSLAGIPFIGDRWTDVEAALAAGCSPILVETSLIKTQIPVSAQKIPVFTNLLQAVNSLVN